MLGEIPFEDLRLEHARLGEEVKFSNVALNIIITCMSMT